MDDTDGQRPDDELLSLLAATDVPLGSDPRRAPAARPDRPEHPGAAPGPSSAPPPGSGQAPRTPAPAPSAPGGAATPAPAPAPPSAPAPPPAPTDPARSRSAFVGPRTGSAVPVVVGRRFQPIAGGSLPRPSPDDPAVALLLAPPGAWVHATLPGRVRRAAAHVAAGALELHGDDGTVLVLTGPAPVVWAVDDEATVTAGQVIGTVVGVRGDPPTDPVTVHAFDPEGRQTDAVAMLVGLPDPGELDLHGDGSFGVDPYRLDLELAEVGP